jgi:excisionase family DNA binding protein
MSVHTPSAEPLAYSPGDAADALGISRQHLYNLMRDGTIPSVKLGRRRLIRREALLSLLDDSGDAQ